jgi:CBS domain-containing protein
MKQIKVKDIMTENPYLISPKKTLRDAAKRMKEIDCGILPVGTADDVVGMITDRDIVIRCLAEDEDYKTQTVEQVMTNDVISCNEDDELTDVADIMAENQVGRLIVMDKNKKVSGIVSFGGIVRNADDAKLINEVLIRASAKAA